MTEYAVFDVETTGFDAERRDRVVEIAIVRVTGLGEVLDEWTTLINPGRDTGPAHVHGIESDHVADAPAFGDVAGEVADRLAGAVLTGHNVSFDLRFVAAEFARASAPLPNDVPSLCTVRMAKAAGMPVPRTLGACCERAGIDLSHAHSALDDTRATAQLFMAFAASGVDPEALVRGYQPRQSGPTWPMPAGRAAALPRNRAPLAGCMA